MTQMLARHGTFAGYRAELQTDSVCDRCRAASRVYNSQYTKANRAKGIRYTTDQVIDHLYQPGRRGRPRRGQSPVRPGTSVTEPVLNPPSPPAPDQDISDTDPTIADKLGQALRGAFVKPPDNDYVPTDEGPDYIHPIDPDAEPSGEWTKADDTEDFVINKAGMVLIEDNLGTYMSVLGITLEMIDPYCGPILAEHFDAIVGRWAKVIARYPAAAKIFMSKDGGTIMTWIGALQATWPVLLAVYDHHLAKNVKTDNLGRSYRVSSSNGTGPTVDATMPPMPGYDYTVD